MRILGPAAQATTANVSVGNKANKHRKKQQGEMNKINTRKKNPAE